MIPISRKAYFSHLFTVTQMLDRLFFALDSLANKHNIFKVETVGETYMGVTNLGNDQEETHVKNIALFAMEAIDATGDILIDEENPKRGACPYSRRLPLW